MSEKFETTAVFRTMFLTPFSKTERLLHLKSLNLVFMEMFFEFRTLVAMAKAALDLVIVDLTSATFVIVPKFILIALCSCFICNRDHSVCLSTNHRCVTLQRFLLPGIGQWTINGGIPYTAHGAQKKTLSFFYFYAYYIFILIEKK